MEHSLVLIHFHLTETHLPYSISMHMVPFAVIICVGFWSAWCRRLFYLHAHIIDKYSAMTFEIAIVFGGCAHKNYCRQGNLQGKLSCQQHTRCHISDEVNDVNLVCWLCAGQTEKKPPLGIGNVKFMQRIVVENARPYLLYILFLFMFLWEACEKWAYPANCTGYSFRKIWPVHGIFWGRFFGKSAKRDDFIQTMARFL